MVENFNKQFKLDEKKFRNFCKTKSKFTSKKSSIDIACSLFYLASECDFEKTDLLVKLIKDKDKYLSDLIKNNFPYCYLIGNLKEKKWFNAKKSTQLKLNNSYPAKSRFIEDENKKKNCLIFSNDLRSHLGGVSIIPYLKIIQKNFNFKFYLLTKNYFQIKYLKKHQPRLFQDYLLYDQKLELKLKNSYFDVFINTTGNLLNSSFIDISNFVGKTLNIWGYLGTSVNSKNNPIILDKNFKNTSCIKFYTEKINYLPYLQSLIINKNKKFLKKKKFKNTIGIFSNSYKLNTKILCVIFSVMKIENLKLIFGYQKANVKKNILNLAKSFNVEKNILFSKSYKFENYINDLKNIDILIDIPFLGGSRSVVDALSLGLPVVTIIGEKSVEKNASCILLDLNLNELIANDLKELPEVIMNTIKNYNIISDKISLSLNKESIQEREYFFLKEFSKIV